jgi:acetyl-CoA carboxylase biotin carboxyl carrier protein
MAPKKKSPSQKASGLPGLELGEMERLLGFMEKHDLEEFEFAHGDFRVSLKRASGNSLPPSAGRGASATASHSHSESHSQAAAATVAETLAQALPKQPESQDHLVKSPIVGTFYSSPSPEAEAFVKVGDRVSKGQVVCIVEAMKLMNEIEADVSGEIVKIMAESGQPVEYGQALFSIRP